MPVVPAIWEAEAEESLEPGRQRLQWAEIVPLHSSLCDRVKFHLKKPINLFNKYLWSPYHLLETALASREIEVDKINKNSHLYEMYILKQLTTSTIGV